MYTTVETTTPFLPDDRPRYLMGVGTPIDLVEAVARGVDMFDCVMPTRNARNGQLFTSDGPLNIKNAQLRRRRSAGRSGVRLLYLPVVFTRLFTPFVPRRRDASEAPLTRCIISTFTLTP